MSPQEDFWNLQSRFRGKKEFNFYDKMVPEPEITQTPTPSVTTTPTTSVTTTPTTTPTLTSTIGTPTPTPTLTMTPTSSLGWNSVYEFTIDTTKQNTNSSGTNAFDFDATGWVFILPDPTDITIYWGDGNSDNPYSTRSHVYSSPGVYTITVDSGSNSFYDKIIPVFKRTETITSTGDAVKLISCNRRPQNPSYKVSEFEKCINFTGLTGNAQYQTLSGDCTGSFRQCYSLVSGLSNFDMSQVTGLSNFFEDCLVYNEDISGWDTGNVVDMSAVFYSATSFNQNLGSWDIGSVVHTGSIPSMVNMFGQSNLQTSNYDQILIGWASQAPNINSGIILFGVPCGYTSAAQSARNLLTTTYGWSITDGGLVP